MQIVEVCDLQREVTITCVQFKKQFGQKSKTVVKLLLQRRNQMNLGISNEATNFLIILQMLSSCWNIRREQIERVSETETKYIRKQTKKNDIIKQQFNVCACGRKSKQRNDEFEQPTKLQAVWIVAYNQHLFQIFNKKGNVNETMSPPKSKLKRNGY